MSSDNPKKYNINYDESGRPESITEDTNDGSAAGLLGFAFLFVVAIVYFFIIGYLPLILSLLTGSFGSYIGSELPEKKDAATKSCWALLCGGLLGSVTFLGANFVEKTVYPETARDSRENVLSIFMNDKIQQKKKARELKELQIKEENLKKDVEKILLNTDQLFE